MQNLINRYTVGGGRGGGLGYFVCFLLVPIPLGVNLLLSLGLYKQTELYCTLLLDPIQKPACCDLKISRRPRLRNLAVILSRLSSSSVRNIVSRRITSLRMKLLRYLSLPFTIC